MKNNMHKSFLDKEEMPTIDELLGLFFDINDDSVVESLTNKLLSEPKDITGLGSPSNIKEIKGEVWKASKITWDTISGPKYLVMVDKVLGDLFNGMTPFNTPTENSFEDIFSGGAFNNLFHYPFTSDVTSIDGSENIMDIDYEMVNNKTYDEMLNEAIEVEDFEKAARLKKWKDGLIELLLDLKPKINEALSEGDLSELDKVYRMINVYRNKLHD